MRELGIYSRLDQVFEAPDAVKEVLISQFGLEHSVCSLTRFISCLVVSLGEDVALCY